MKLFWRLWPHECIGREFYFLHDDFAPAAVGRAFPLQPGQDLRWTGELWCVYTACRRCGR